MDVEERIKEGRASYLDILLEFETKINNLETENQLLKNELAIVKERIA